MRRVMPTITSHLRSRRFSSRCWVGINFQPPPPPPPYSLIFLPLEGQPPRNSIHLPRAYPIFFPFVSFVLETPFSFFFFSSRPFFDFRDSFSIYPARSKFFGRYWVNRVIRSEIGLLL